MILPGIIRILFVVFFLILSPTSYVSAQTGTNTPTQTPTHTPTPTPSNSSPYCASLTSDITTANGTPQSVTFTCAGVDPGGLIMAAEFIFGDGTSQTVEKNVGSPGSISVAHTYNTIGSLGASCRVRDNDNVFSPTGDACKKVITIRPATSATKAPTTSTTLTPTATPVATVTATLTPVPTISIDPTLYPQDDLLTQDYTGPNRFLWIGLGALSLIAAFLLLRRRKPKIPTHNTPLPTQPPTPPTAPPVPPTAPPVSPPPPTT